MGNWLKIIFQYTGLLISWSIQYTFFFRFFNLIYESSPYVLIKFFVKYVKLPQRDIYWTVRLLNKRTIRTNIYANNNKTAQFALSYQWHSPALNFTENLLNKYYPIDIPWLDVGSNLGLRSLRSLSEKRPVFFFEPNTELNKFNVERCQLNGFVNYKVFGLGVSDSKGSVEFLIDKTSYNSTIETHLLIEDSIDHIEIIRTDTIDNLYRDNFNEISCACIKIDVEGHELHVIKGARTLISAVSPTMIIEVNQKGDHFLKFVDIMKEYGYNIYELGDFGKKFYFKKILIDQPINLAEISNNDFLAVKDDDLQKIINKYTAT